MKYYNHKGTKVYLQKGEYQSDGTLAVLMFKENGEPFGTITVNLDNPLQSEELAFLDEKTFPGIRKWIRKNKIGEFTGYEACPDPILTRYVLSFKMIAHIDMNRTPNFFSYLFRGSIQ